MHDAQLAKVGRGQGFVAALDQSGGSTPGALARYGIDASSWSSQKQMYELIHAFRTRIITSPSFTGERIIAAILFERTLERDLDGLGVPDYLWQRKQIVPFLKVDRGLAEEADGVRLMKPMPDLDGLLGLARARNVFGTKMRSVVLAGNQTGIDAVLDQQFEVGRQILAAGLMPILEPEVDIHAPDKAVAEAMVTAGILDRLAELPADQRVMLKLTIPSEANLYLELIGHPRVLRVVALSGGYSREEANRLLAANNGLIASFSRALTEGLLVSMSDAEFDAALAASIDSIYAASTT
ncbi:MAG: fructose bisphosphate aldolase [Propionibacteriaceae bacterium]|nr:fructose bisphosphate aldolase [Propionibacteriaceae bacterium]